MTHDPIITMEDLAALYCAPGIAKRLVRMGIDVDDFMKNGMRASEMMGRGHDAHIARAVDKKVSDNG